MRGPRISRLPFAVHELTIISRLSTPDFGAFWSKVIAMPRKNSPSFALLAALGLSATSALGMGSRPPLDEEAINARIQPLARVEFAAPQQGPVAGKRSGEDLYKAFCIVCHGAGVAGSPKLGDQAAWAPRIKLGLDALLKSATAGKNAMPPKGGSDATPEELARAIAFMANQAGAKFKAP